MKYKVGDKVRIKNLDWYNENKDEYGYIDCGSRAFFTKMSDWCGKIATIKEICKTNCYRLEEYDFDWTDEMIEGLAEEENQPKFKVGDRVKWYNHTCDITSIDTSENTRKYLISNFDYREDKVLAKWVPEGELTVEDDEETSTKLTGKAIENNEMVIGVDVIEELKTYRDNIKGAWICPEGYQFKDENGNVINATKIVLEKKTDKDMTENNTKVDMGEVSDGYHTFNELYEYRMLYNAALFNEFAKQGLYDVHKSRKHSDGEYPFGDSNWFIVMAELPTGQISNHYEMKDWDKFQIPEKPLANKWDEHSPKDVAERLTSFTNPKKEYPKTYEECCYVLGFENTELVFEDDYRDINPPKEQWKRLGLINQLNKLLICRDAYWKLYGEEMGLGNPWEPDWDDDEWPDMYYISWDGKCLEKEKGYPCCNMILIFPTEEMRDAFKENFDPDIEICKELL